MKNSAKCARQFASLLKKIGSVEPPPVPPTGDPIRQLIFSFMLWEATTDKALTAYKCLDDAVVDFNDLRVCMAQEVVDCIGPRYPRALDRSQRLRAVLRDIYSREHAVTLDRLHELGKREVRTYLASLEGMVPYVEARVSQLVFDAHAIPVDDQLRTQLVEVGAADVSVDNTELAVWIERHVKAIDAAAAHYALQAWVDSLVAKPAARKKSRTAKTRKTPAKKTKKKMSKT